MKVSWNQNFMVVTSEQTSFTKINDQTEAWRDMKNDLQDTPYCQNNKDRTLAQNNIVCE